MQIKLKFLIHPSELIKGVKSVVLDQISRMVNSCGKQYGYITKVNNINIHKDQYVKYSGHIEAGVCLNAITYVPSLDSIVQCDIVYKTTEGLWCTTVNRMNVFVLTEDLQSYSVGDNINAKIFSTRFVENGFNCLAYITVDK
jgi:DNA-directed RNA polymerase subunit E'/Rpb7